MSYTPANVIEVRAWGRRVGAVARDPTTGAYVFSYAPEWLATEIELSPLFMPLRSEPYSRLQWPDLGRDSFFGLAPLLADSLPDDFGNALVNSWMESNGVARSDITSLDRLAYAADRALGALEFRPPARRTDEESPSSIQMADLVVAARMTVSGNFASDASTHDALSQLIQVGSSAGGARAKAVIAFQPETLQLRSPYAELPAGFEHWLIKIDGVSATGMDGHGGGLGETSQYGRIEYAYYRMAVAAGIAMSPSRLLAEGPRRHFMTRRFDRDGERRLHVLSLAAMAHLDHTLVGVHSYDQFLATCRALGLGPGDLAQAYRRMVYNVAAVIRDDHTKNFAFLLRQGGRWELAPAYDLTHSYRRDSEWTSRQNLSVNSKTEDIAITDLYAVAERHDVPGYRELTREVFAAVDAWPQFADEADVSDVEREHVASDLARFRPR